METVVEGFRRLQGNLGGTSRTLTAMWPITVPVSTSHQTLFPQELPSVGLSAQVGTQLARVQIHCHFLAV